jgi:hypothetical protein
MKLALLTHKPKMFNWSAHADTQQQIAAARRVLRVGGLER